MKRSILASTLLLLLLCGCGSRTPPERERRFGGKGRADQSEKSEEPPAMYVELPKGWTQRGRGFGFGGREAADLENLDAHFRFDFQPQAEFDGDLMAWAKARKQATAEKSPIANRQETELIPNRIGTHDVVEYEITEEVAGIQGRTRVIFLSVGTWFCRLTCWTKPANWATAQPKFEELLDHIKIGPPPAPPKKAADPAAKQPQPPAAGVGRPAERNTTWSRPASSRGQVL